MVVLRLVSAVLAVGGEVQVVGLTGGRGLSIRAYTCKVGCCEHRSVNASTEWGKTLMCSQIKISRLVARTTPKTSGWLTPAGAAQTSAGKGRIHYVCFSGFRIVL